LWRPNDAAAKTLLGWATALAVYDLEVVKRGVMVCEMPVMNTGESAMRFAVMRGKRFVRMRLK
jgi:hypothetical protein